MYNKRYIPRIWNKFFILKDVFNAIFKYIDNPKEKIFVDLFGWWWSVSVNATNFFKSVVYNEINKDVVEWFKAVQNTDFLYKLKDKWISKEEFNSIKNKVWKLTWEESVILSIRSFWYTRKNYLYWEHLIPIKKKNNLKY